MVSTFVDRKSAKPGRFLVTPENGGDPYYVTIERADEPIILGTQLNANTLNNLAMDGVKERNTKHKLAFWVGTQAEYDALDEKPANTYMIITDEQTEELKGGVCLFDNWDSGFGSESTYPISLDGYGDYTVMLVEVSADDYDNAGTILVNGTIDSDYKQYSGMGLLTFESDTTGDVVVFAQIYLHGTSGKITNAGVSVCRGTAELTDRADIKIRRIVGVC